MTEPQRSNSDAKRKSRTKPGLIRLFFMQAAASLVCGIFFLLMHSLPVPTLNNCARALGDALRFEMELPTEKLPRWITEGISR